MHAGKRFKALIDSGAALLLAHTCVYNMIKECYVTKILPAAVHLKTADRSSMSSLGKTTLHLHITNFMFYHTFIICDKLLETDILFGIDIQKRYSLSYIIWAQINNYSYRGKAHFFNYTRYCEQQHTIAVSEISLKITM